MDKQFFLYTRVSVSDQYDVSLDTQEKVLGEISHERGIKNIHTIRETKSGGGKTKRNEFDKMVSLLEGDSKKGILEREYGGVLFYKLDRLARNTEDFYRIENLVMKGYKFISATEIIENTPTGKLLLRMLSSFAIYEQERSSSRKIISMIENVFEKQFGRLGLGIHFGYDHQNQKITVNKQEKQIINDIYNYFLEDKTYDEISHLINHKYIHPKKTTKGYLEGYIIGKKFKNSSTLVENIILNNHFIKYNGVVERTINITDELVSKHIQYLKGRNVTDFDEKQLVVGETLNVDIYINDLSIVEEHIYHKIQQKFNPKDTNPPLFSNVLFFKDKKGEHEVYSGLTKGWYYYTSKNNNKHSISERKLVSIISQKSLLKNIDKVSTIEEQIVPIFNELSVSYYSKDIQRSNLKEQFYIEKIDELKTIKKTKKSAQIIEEINYTINGYTDLLTNIRKHRGELEKKINTSQNNFLKLFSKTSFSKDKDRILYSLKYGVIFKKIIIEDKKITFYPHVFLQNTLGYKRKSVKM